MLIRTGGAITLFYKMGLNVLASSTGNAQGRRGLSSRTWQVFCKAVLEGVDGTVCLSSLLSSIDFHSETLLMTA